MSETTPLWKNARCLLSGVGTRPKDPFLPGWVEHRAFELHVWCLLGLAMASDGIQPTNSSCPVVATELMWLGHRQFTPTVSPGLSKWRDHKPASTCPDTGGEPFSRDFVNAVGVQRPRGAQPCDCTECRTLISPDLPNTVSHHYLPGQKSISSLLQWLWVIRDPLAL